jgi:hypothetical protein
VHGALLSRIRASGREFEFELTPRGAVLGLAETLRSGGSSLEFRVMVGARGLDPAGPTPRIVLPELITEALHLAGASAVRATAR